MSNKGGNLPYDVINRQSAVLRLLLTQAGTAAPTASILQGTLPQQYADTPLTPAFARSSAGTYTLTLAGAFPSGQVFAKSGLIDAATGSRYKVVRTSDNVLTITSYIADGTLTDGLFSATPIEINVF